MICKHSKIIDQIIRRENTPLSFCSYHVPEILVWGQKRRHTPPPPPHYISAFVQPISWPTSRSHDWLIDCYRRVGVRDPDRSHTQTPSIFTSLRITDVKSVLLFLLPTGWVGRQFFFIQLEFADSRVSPAAAYLIQLFLHVVFARRIKSWDRKRLVLFPLNIKQSPNLVY